MQAALRIGCWVWGNHQSQAFTGTLQHTCQSALGFSISYVPYLHSLCPGAAYQCVDLSWIILLNNLYLFKRNFGSNVTHIVSVSVLSYQNVKKPGSSDFVRWKKPDTQCNRAPIAWLLLECIANSGIRFLCRKSLAKLFWCDLYQVVFPLPQQHRTLVNVSGVKAYL